jgi:hypothetical protein
VYAADPQNENQNVESSQENNSNILEVNISQEHANKLEELEKEYDSLAKKLDAYYKKVSNMSYENVEDFVNQVNETKEEGDKLVIAKNEAAIALSNYKELLRSISK